MRIKRYIVFILALFVCILPLPMKAEKTEIVALKNNLAYDAILTPNLQLEFRLTRKWTMEVGAGFNPFPLDDTKFPKWRHVSAWIAPRYWFCNAFNRGFISFNAAYAHYNVAGGKYPIGWMYKKVLDSRYQGDAAMAGVSFGWHFPITHYFSIELEAGVNAGYTWFNEYECKHCGEKKSDKGGWFALPKLGVNLSFPLGGDKESLARRCDCDQIEDKGDEGLPREFIAPLPVPVDSPLAMLPYEPVLPTPRENSMQRLRSRLLRSEEDYEPYTQSMALSADPRNVFLYFDVNVTKMDRSYIKNDLLMDSIMHIIGEAIKDSTIRISHIRIVGFASFDGKQRYNEQLAGSRAQTIKEYMQSLYPLQDSIFDVCNGGESWAELQYQLQSIDYPGHKEVMHIIATEPDPDKREVLIKRLNKGATYRYMRDELKHILRNLGCITVYYEHIDD